MKTLATLAMAALLLAAVPATADDFSLTLDFDDVGPAAAYTEEHQDEEPWAGWLRLTVTNTGTEPWGDFHFQIFEVPGFGAVDNVDWITDPPYEPYSTQSSLTWDVDNASVGATIDLYFYDDPVLPNETAEFHVYNVNPDQLSFFGTSLYPTPLPEPATLALLGLGALALVRRR